MDGQPTLVDFQTFVANVMQVPDTALNLTAPIVGYCFDFAFNFVNPNLASVPNRAGTGWSLYQLAIYNLAADTLAKWAQDAANAPVYKNGMAYWAWLKNEYGIDNFVAGVLSSTSDESTSASFQIPKAFDSLTIANLGNLKTPWGRTYLGIAQSWGSVWGRN